MAGARPGRLNLLQSAMGSQVRVPHLPSGGGLETGCYKGRGDGCQPCLWLISDMRGWCPNLTGIKYFGLHPTVVRGEITRD